MINPVPGDHDWIETGLTPILPPKCRKQTGRPKKLRRRAADEPRNPYKVSRVGRVMTCQRCGGLRHNTRSCKGQGHEQAAARKATRKVYLSTSILELFRKYHL